MQKAFRADQDASSYNYNTERRDLFSSSMILKIQLCIYCTRENSTQGFVENFSIRPNKAIASELLFL